MYKFERKLLLIAVTVAVFLILLAVLIYFLISEFGNEESPLPEEQTRGDREEILKALGADSEAGESKFSVEEREAILKSLSVPKK